MALRDVERVSSGGFKPTSIAGYERGERSISLERFCQLATFYGISPDRLLGEILEQISPHGRRQIVVDLNRLILILGDEGGQLTEFVRNVRVMRGNHLSDVISLRSRDLEALALSTGLEPEELLERLLPALRPTTAKDR